MSTAPPPPPFELYEDIPAHATAASDADPLPLTDEQRRQKEEQMHSFTPTAQLAMHAIKSALDSGEWLTDSRSLQRWLQQWEPFAKKLLTLVEKSVRSGTKCRRTLLHMVLRVKTVPALLVRWVLSMAAQHKLTNKVVSARDELARTPLHYAAAYQSHPKAREKFDLIFRSCSATHLGMADKFGQLPVHCAAAAGYTRVYRLLSSNNSGNGNFELHRSVDGVAAYELYIAKLEERVATSKEIAVRAARILRRYKEARTERDECVDNDLMLRQVMFAAARNNDQSTIETYFGSGGSPHLRAARHSSDALTLQQALELHHSMPRPSRPSPKPPLRRRSTVGRPNYTTPPPPPPGGPPPVEEASPTPPPTPPRKKRASHHQRERPYVMPFADVKKGLGQRSNSMRISASPSMLGASSAATVDDEDEPPANKPSAALLKSGSLRLKPTPAVEEKPEAPKMTGVASMFNQTMLDVLEARRGAVGPDDDDDEEDVHEIEEYVMEEEEDDEEEYYDCE